MFLQRLAPLRPWPRLGGLLLAALALLAAPSQARVFDRIVAIVNDDIITLSELDEAARPVIERLKESSPRPGAPLERQLFEAKAQILRMMVDQKLAEQEISRLGIAVTPEDIDRVIADVKREANMTEEELRQALKEEGISWEEYRKQVGEQLCRARLVNEEVRTKIVITDERCRRYYEENEAKFRVYDEAEVEQILLAVRPGMAASEREAQHARAQELLAVLQAGADFATLARQYSDAPTKVEGGRLGWLRLDEMAPNLKKVIAALKPGGLSEVVVTDQGFQIFRLRDFRAGGLKPFEQVKDEIYRELFQQEVDREYEAWLSGLRKKAYIKLTL